MLEFLTGRAMRWFRMFDQETGTLLVTGPVSLLYVRVNYVVHPGTEHPYCDGSAFVDGGQIVYGWYIFWGIKRSRNHGLFFLRNDKKVSVPGTS